MSATLLHCSFCGKSQDEVKPIIAGPAVFICGECVDLCVDIIKTRETTEDLKRPRSAATLTPRGIRAVLDEHVIGQDRAKKVLSVALHNHYKRLNANIKATPVETEIAKSNILLIGPTGCGKTLLAETLAQVLDVPFVVIDVTTLTQAGYVGDDVDSIIVKLLQKCDYNVERAQRGIIYLDEIDKLSRKSQFSVTRDVGGEGVQQALLKMIEGTVCTVPDQGAQKPAVGDKLRVDTRNILFICGGAFAGLDQAVAERTQSRSIGFTGSVVPSEAKATFKEMIKTLEPQDLINFGLIPEFVGRLPVFALLEELTEETLVKVLTEPKNALVRQYQKLFNVDKKELQFTRGALELVAKLALARKTGARGLRTILENALLDTMYELSDTPGSSQVLIDEEVIESGGSPKVSYAKVEPVTTGQVAGACAI